MAKGFNKAVQMQRLHGFWKCLKVEELMCWKTRSRTAVRGKKRDGVL